VFATAVISSACDAANTWLRKFGRLSPRSSLYRSASREQELLLVERTYRAMSALSDTQWIVLFLADVVSLGGLLIWAFYELEQMRQRMARQRRLRACGMVAQQPPQRQ
jgi:hypothetical protein